MNSLKREWETIKTGLELNVWRLLDECSDIIDKGLEDINSFKIDGLNILPEKELSGMKPDELRDYIKNTPKHVNVQLQDAQTEFRELCEEILNELNGPLADLPAKVNEELSRFSLLKFYDIL